MVDQAKRKDSQAYLALCLHHQVGSIVQNLLILLPLEELIISLFQV